MNNNQDISTTSKELLTKQVKWYQPSFIIATWFGSGKIPFAPGTMGSIFTLPLFFILSFFIIFTNKFNQFALIYIAILIILYIIGHYSTHIYMQRTGKEDPKEVVIDEVVGQLIVSFGGFVVVDELFQFSANFYDYKLNISSDISDLIEVYTNIIFLAPYLLATCIVQLICLILFRFFDIFKPSIIGWCDKNVKGSFGVMLDDIIAALFALFSLFGTIMVISSFFIK